MAVQRAVEYATATLYRVAAALRAVVDGVRTAPDATADPPAVTYLAGYTDALRAVAKAPGLSSSRKQVAVLK